MVATLLISFELFVGKKSSIFSYLVGSVTICVRFWPANKSAKSLFCLFDLILYVHSTIFQLCGTGLPGLNQY